MMEITSIRHEFPILDQHIHGKPLIYLDNAATTQKPLRVLNAIAEFYQSYNANIHRGTHYLARLATERYENARAAIADFLRCKDVAEVIFTAGATDSLNLAAHCVAARLLPGDEVLISTLEHHSNIVPWQMVCERTGAVLKVLPCDEWGRIHESDVDEMLSSGRVKVLAVTWVSNAFGTVNPVQQWIAKAREAHAFVVIDAAQAVSHISIDVNELDADCIAFSGHKVYAPTGIGVLWGKRDFLEASLPYRGGGEMIREVTFEKTTYNELPFKFEAGTPNIEGAIALAEALGFLSEVGLEHVADWENLLIRKAETELMEIDGMRLFGPPDRMTSLSFEIDGVHAYDLGTLLDQLGVAVRTGHHCCQPLMARFGVSGTTRASFACYNTLDEVDVFVASVKKTLRLLR